MAQVRRELGINANMIGRWQRELERDGWKAFLGRGVARDDEMAELKRELSRVKKERDFFARSGNVLRERPEVKYRVIERCREAYSIRLPEPLAHPLKASLAPGEKAIESSQTNYR